MSNVDSGRRARATAVVLRDGCVLLVRDRGEHRFSLPGGRIEWGELPAGAAARELWEELGVQVIRVERIRECDHADSSSNHHVCLVEIGSDPPPHVTAGEIDEFVWSDIARPAPPLLDHVAAIVGSLERLGRIRKPDLKASPPVAGGVIG